MLKPISKDASEFVAFMTERNCENLKKLIVENPELPLFIFAGEEAWSGEYAYESVNEGYSDIKEITLYDHQWLDRDDFEDVLRDDMADDKRYENLSEEEFDEEVSKLISETAFVKAIVICVG